MLDLYAIIPEVKRKLPSLDVKGVEFEEDGKSYTGVAFIHRTKVRGPGRVFMTTLVVVGDHLVFGIHADGRETCNMQRLLEGVDESHLVSILCEIWGDFEPN